MLIPASISDLAARSTVLRDLLIRWCEQNSGSDNEAGLDAMLALLVAEFRRLPGAEIDTPALAGSRARALRIRVRPAAPHQILLSGHFDTVYGATHPFQRCEVMAPDRLRGPGVADMKGGLVVMLATLEAFAQTPHAANLGYEVLLGPDEETGSGGTAPLLAECARRHQLGLVFEPARANGDLVHSRKGPGTITVTCHGRSAHAANAATQGRNAIAALAGFLVAAHRLPTELPGVLVNIGQIRGGLAPNIVPDLAEAVLDVRVTQAADWTDTVARLRLLAEPVNATEGFRLELTEGHRRPPMERHPVADAAFAAWRQCGADLRLAPFSSIHSGGGSDANNLSAAGLPCLDGLGPVGDRLHSPEEWVLLPSLVERAQVAALFLHRAASGEVSIDGFGTVGRGR